MTIFPTAGVADEILRNRRTSPIGAPQRHYRLEPALVTADGVCGQGVVVVAGARGTYAYASDDAGHITDFDPIHVSEVGSSDGAVLARLGYEMRSPLRDSA